MFSNSRTLLSRTALGLAAASAYNYASSGGADAASEPENSSSRPLLSSFNVPPQMTFLQRARAEEPFTAPSTSGSASNLPAPYNKDDLPLTRGTFVRAAAAVGPSVVHIDLRPREQRPHGGFWGAMFEFGGSAASGFLVSEDGTLFTNAHVVKTAYGPRAREKVVVTLNDGRTFDAAVLYMDETTDVAALRIVGAPPGTKFPAAKLGNSSHLRAGDFVLAIGSPFMLQFSVSHGIVSKPDRRKSDLTSRSPFMSREHAQRGRVHEEAIQVDCAINSGNSGGPLVSLDGEVVGIISAKLISFGSEGIGFAVPINTAVKVLDQLGKYGRVLRPYIGLRLLQLSPALADQIRLTEPGHLDPSINAGLLVAQVHPGSPSEGKLEEGDVIVGLRARAAGAGEAETVTLPNPSVKQLLEVLGENVGRTVELEVAGAKKGNRCVRIKVEEQGVGVL